MIVDLKWREAMVSVPRGYFDEATLKAGWPKTMQPNQLAILQRPHKKGDVEGWRLARALYDEILEACKAGRLECKRTTEIIPGTPEGWLPRDASHRGSNGPWLPVAGGPRRYKPATPTKEIELFEVAAVAFSAWLAGQGIEPSHHIKHWLQVCGVGVAKPCATLHIVAPAEARPPGKIPHKSQAPDWDGARLEKRQGELKRQGYRDCTKRLANESGLPEREITRRIKEYRDSQAPRKRA